MTTTPEVDAEIAAELAHRANSNTPLEVSLPR
jgi:hypothetical protein